MEAIEAIEEGVRDHDEDMEDLEALEREEKEFDEFYIDPKPALKRDREDDEMDIEENFEKRAKFTTTLAMRQTIIGWAFVTIERSNLDLDMTEQRPCISRPPPSNYHEF